MVGGSLRVLRFLPPQKTGHHDIAEILLKYIIIIIIIDKFIRNTKK
jgi:hypothetical protein